MPNKSSVHKCPNCGKTFKTKQALQQHKASMHNMQVKQQNAPKRARQRQRRGGQAPGRQSRQNKYEMISEPVAYAVVPTGNVKKDNTQVWSQPIGMAFKTGDGDSVSKFFVTARNYERYKIGGVRAIINSMMPEGVIGGYGSTFFFSPDASDTVETLDRNSLRAKHHVIIPPGTKSAVLTLGSDLLTKDFKGWKYVDSSGKPANQVSYGQFGLVVHGEPTSAYTNTVYEGPMYTVELEFTNVEFDSWHPNNGPESLPNLQETSTLVLSTDDDGKAIISGTALRILSQSLPRGVEGGLGKAVGSVLVKALDEAAGLLPPPFNWLGKGVLMFVRALTGLTRADIPRARLYRTYDDAVADHGLNFAGTSAQMEAVIEIQALTPTQIVSPAMFVSTNVDLFEQTVAVFVKEPEHINIQYLHDTSAGGAGWMASYRCEDPDLDYLFVGDKSLNCGNIERNVTYNGFHFSEWPTQTLSTIRYPDIGIPIVDVVTVRYVSLATQAGKYGIIIRDSTLDGTTHVMDGNMYFWKDPQVTSGITVGFRSTTSAPAGGILSEPIAGLVQGQFPVFEA
jgi:hypothetical protein